MRYQVSSSEPLGLQWTQSLLCRAGLLFLSRARVNSSSSTTPTTSGMAGWYAKFPAPLDALTRFGVRMEFSWRSSLKCISTCSPNPVPAVCKADSCSYISSDRPDIPRSRSTPSSVAHLHQARRARIQGTSNRPCK